MALVVNGICRFAFEGFYIDRPWVNICDMQLDTTGAIYDRDDWAFQTAGRLINGWVDHLADRVSESLVLNQVSWVDLDSATGSTGSRTVTSEHELPEAGFHPAEPLPGNLSVLITKNTNAGRGTRSGRWYQAGLTEPQVVDNSLIPATVDMWQDSFNAFKTYIEEPSDPIGGAQRHMAVVHTTGDNPQTGTFTTVDSLTVNPRLATQRRRLRG